LLIEAAKKYKVKGLGITLSHEQKAKFEERIKAEGLEDYLEVELMDYRDLPKTKRTAPSPAAVFCAVVAARRLLRFCGVSPPPRFFLGSLFIALPSRRKRLYYTLTHLSCL